MNKIVPIMIHDDVPSPSANIGAATPNDASELLYIGVSSSLTPHLLRHKQCRGRELTFFAINNAAAASFDGGCFIMMRLSKRHISSVYPARWKHFICSAGHMTMGSPS